MSARRQSGRDVATGGTGHEPVVSKRQGAVFAAARAVREPLPFPLPEMA